MPEGRLLFIGLGLWDAADMSHRARDLVREADAVVAEFYTARLMGATHRDLEAAVGRTIELLPRHAVESGRDLLLARCKGRTLAFLTAGDPLTATTHQDLRVAALDAGYEVRVVHAASIKTAAPGLVGLSDYKFSRTTTLTLPRGEYLPESPLDVILENRARGLHTLVLLDLDAENDRFMSATEGAASLLEMLRRRAARGDAVDPQLLSPRTPIIAVARAGSRAPLLTAASLEQLAGLDLGGPLHTLIVPGDLSEDEARIAGRITGYALRAGRA